MVNTNFPTQEGSNQNMRLLNAKNHTPPESKANHNKRQTQSKTPTPLEHKYKPLKQQDKSMHKWPSTVTTKAKTIINNHKHKPRAAQKQRWLTEHDLQ
jgi:hypothetical protein